MFRRSTSLPIRLLTRLQPTGSIERLSSQSKSMPVSEDAGYTATGMCTRPKVMAPFQIARGMATSVGDADERRPDAHAR